MDFDFNEVLKRGQKWPSDGPPPPPINCQSCQVLIPAVKGPFCWQHELNNEPSINGVCKPCRDKKNAETQKTKREMFEAEQMRAYLETVPARYKNSSLNDFTEAQKDVLSGWIGDNSWLLLLMGGTGAGKTHAAYAVCRKYQSEAIKAPHPRPMPYFKTVPDLLDELRRQVMGESQDETTKALQERAGIVFLDDLGAEKTSEFALQELYRILAAREANYLKTIITTNLDLTDIDRLSARIASRLCSGTVLRFSGKDRRKG